MGMTCLITFPKGVHSPRPRNPVSSRNRVSRGLSLAVFVVAALGRGAAVGDDPRKDRPKSDPLAEAKALANREEWPGAVEQYRAFLKQHPDHPRASEARFWIGYCLVKLDEWDEATNTLRPFETLLADDTWADDALLQLGRAYRGKGETDLALAAWKRLLDRYPDSVWRHEAMMDVIDLLFHDAEDYAACLPYCERVVQEIEDRGSTGEARYIGAYCLNALHRFDDAERWIERWFDPDSALEEAWRRLLGAQRDLIAGKPEAALAAVAGLERDFPDLDESSRRDVLLRTSTILRQNGRAERARELLLNELRRASGWNPDDLSALLDELDAAYGDDARAPFLKALAKLVDDQTVPLGVRVAIRERQVQALRDGERLDEALALLRSALKREPTEFARFRAAMLLAELLAEGKEDPKAAVGVLNDLVPTLKRRDLLHQARSETERYGAMPENKDEAR
jgi:tetratricopeptide (TPR) repeat protein